VHARGAAWRQRGLSGIDGARGAGRHRSRRKGGGGMPRLGGARGGGGLRGDPGPRAGRLSLGLSFRALLDFQLTDEQRLISESAREFCDKEIAPRVRENDRAGRFDRELASKLGEMGYLGAPVAEEYGGRSLDYLSYALVVEQVGRVDSSARTVVSVQTSLVAGSIERWGTEEQKREWLPPLCSGEALGGFAATDPSTGSGEARRLSSASTRDA